MTEEQIQLVDRTLDTLHAEVVAGHRSSMLPVLLLMIGLGAPLLVALYVLLRAERAALGMDETLRTLLQSGDNERLIRGYLDNQQSRRQLPAPATPKQIAGPQSRARRRRRRKPRGPRAAEPEESAGAAARPHVAYNHVVGVGVRSVFGALRRPRGADATYCSGA